MSSDTKVFLPRKFRRGLIGGFLRDLDSCKEASDVCVDFSRLVFSYPVAMMVVGASLKEWVSFRRDAGLITRKAGIDESKSAHSYLMHLGFFDFIGSDIGKSVGEASGNNNYLPITRVSKPEFNPFDNPLEDWYRLIQYESDRLAKLLVFWDSEQEKAFGYLIREVLRNVFEHSNATECYVCGQRWHGGKVQISIIDAGVGITSTLREVYDISSDRQALEMATEPGISRASQLSDDGNIYDNSGYGLYVLSEIGAQYGWFCMGSGDAVIIKNDEGVVFEDVSFKGTYIGLQLDKEIDNIGVVLDGIIDRGEKISGVNIKASAASRLPVL
jgi:hypothetical protein